jgi:hypothetical protein
MPKTPIVFGALALVVIAAVVMVLLEFSHNVRDARKQPSVTK